MPPVQTINLMRPIGGACVVNAEELRMAEGGGRNSNRLSDPPSGDRPDVLREQREELARSLEIVRHLADRLHTLQEETLASNRSEIAKLAVEIARKILPCRVGKRDYEIQAIVEEALQQAPTRQNIVVHLNPEDLPQCRQLQQETTEGPWAELELVADGSVGRGECLVETPKGVVRSFLEEHLDRIAEAMERVE